MKKSLFQVLFTCTTLLLFPSCSTRGQNNNPATQKASESKTEDFRDQIRKLISEGKTEEALRHWVETGNSSAILLQKRFDAAKDQYSKGLIDYSEWARIQAQINYALLETGSEAVTDTNAEKVPDVKTAISSDTILYLVSEGNTADALQLLTEAGFEDALLQVARFEASKKQFSMGLINYDEWSRIQAQINSAILEMTPSDAKATNNVVIPRDHIIKLVEAGKLEDALRLLFPAKPDESTLILARLKTAQKYHKIGTVDSPSLNQIKTQIAMAILEMSQ